MGKRKKKVTYKKHGADLVPSSVQPGETQPTNSTTKKKSNVGKVYRGRTKYIDTEPKLERNYVVVVDDGEHIKISKLKSVKIFDENGKNADKALVEINATRYGLEKRTGVDSQVYSKNRMSGRPLQIKDKRVFPEEKERFALNNKDKHNVLVHTKVVNDPRKKRRDN